MGNDQRRETTGGRDGSGRLSQDDLDVEKRQILAPDGSYDPERVPDLTDDELLDLHRWMLLERRFDERMVSLQRRGELGTFASGRGQEASIVGSGSALADPDWLLGMGRESAAQLMAGVSMRELVLFWRGVEDASRAMAANNVGVAISIGSQLPMATGIAWGIQLDGVAADGATTDGAADGATTDDAPDGGTDAVAAAYFGDGATSTGAFNEGVNLAGVLGVPAVFYCQNNQYAISTPFERQTNARTVAQKALAFGLDGIRVDGNDVLAVYDAMAEARALAREGRPVLVESVTYRRDAHTTSDDPTRYRDEAEVEEWADRDPIDRYRSFLRSEGLWDRIDEDAVEATVDEEVDAAVAAADEYGPRDVGEIFAHLHAELPPELDRQLDGLRAFLDDHPEAEQYVERRPKG